MLKLKDNIQTQMKDHMAEFMNRNDSREKFQDKIKQLEKEKEKRSISPVQDNTSDSEILFENKNQSNVKQSGISEKTLQMVEMKKNY